jgi:hypothetical protein
MWRKSREKLGPEKAQLFNGILTNLHDGTNFKELSSDSTQLASSKRLYKCFATG